MKTIKVEPYAFLSINLSRMGDKRGVSSDDIEVDADKDRVKVRKVIFKSAAFDVIKSLDSEIRRYVRSQCFPYESGLHLIPMKLVDQINSRLVDYRCQRFELVANFANIYPTMMEENQPKLRKLHNENDYLTGVQVYDSFSMSWQFVQLSTPTDLESVSSEILKQERDKMQGRLNEAFEEARLLLRETCLNLVAHLRNSLENDAHGAPKRLASSTVRNLQEFLNNFNLRDITNDGELSELITQAKNLTNGIDAESLRTMDGLRARVRGELGLIEESITKTLIVEPTRRIRTRGAA